MTESRNATYVYCVVHARRRLSGSRMPMGIPGGSPPRPVALDEDLWMVVADAPARQYAENALHANLRRLDWVSKVAVGHEAVVEHFTRLRGATVVPMKLLTMFSSDDKARDELLARRRPIDAAVRRIAGCEEWGVRIFADRTASSTPSQAGAFGPSGTAFLAARKAAREAGRSARARAIDAARDTYQRLAKMARATAERPRNGEPAENPPLLEAAFLVVVPARAQFKAAAKREAAVCAAAGAVMTLTGPWPAYNFVGDTGDTK